MVAVVAVAEAPRFASFVRVADARLWRGTRHGAGHGQRRVHAAGRAQAVKHLSADHATGGGDREFSAKLEVLGSLSHRYLYDL